MKITKDVLKAFRYALQAPLINDDHWTPKHIEKYIKICEKIENDGY